MSNDEVEDQAVLLVLHAERAAGREPADVRHTAHPFDVSSPPRKIEVKSFSQSARGMQVPLEHRQVKAVREDPDNFYLYVVDNVGLENAAIRVIHGARLMAMIDRAEPVLTYWPTLRVAEYDSADQLP
jgi:hypothetical protein